MEKTCWETLAELRSAEAVRCENKACHFNFKKTCSGCAILEREKFVASRRSGANSIHDKSSYFKIDDGSYIALREGMTGSELADMIGCTRANISQCTKRSLKRIRDHIENHV